MIFVPITGKPLHHMDFMYQIQANYNLTGVALVEKANDIQQKYELCIGGPHVIKEAEKQFITTSKTFVLGGLVGILKELELSHNRKKTSILDGKVLNNNEPASTK